MFYNTIKIAIRYLWNNPFYSFIGIVGLSIAISSSLLMLVYLSSELNYDRFNESPEQIYRVVFDNYLELGPYATSPLPVGPALQTDFPEIQAMTRISTGFNSLVKFDNHKFFENLAFVDTGLSQVFKLSFIAGDSATALSAPNQLIISETYANKYFGDQDPLGKTLQIGSSGSLNSIVSGVFRDFPQNSHIRFDIALPFTTFEKVWGPPNLWQQMPSNYSYVRIKEKAEIGILQSKLPAFAEKHVGNQLENWQENYQLALQPLLDIHLYSDYNREKGKGDLKSLYLLGFIAFLVLLIAIINYINYATARFTKRIKEVSIRKIVGANRWHLISQFIGETFLTVLIAGLLAIGLAELFLPVFNLAAGKSYQQGDLHTWTFYVAIGVLIPFVSIVAGLFPALFLAGFQPGDTLRGKFARLSVAHLSRKGLIVVQFTASIALLTATLVVWKQMNFVRDSIRPQKDEQIAVIQVNNNISEKYEALRQEILNLAGVQSVSGGSNVPTFYGDSWPVRLDLNSKPVQMENYAVKDDFLETMGYEMITGRPLSSKLASDVESGFILNETAVSLLGFSNADSALGKRIYWGSSQKKEGYVIGVIKDFHFQSLHNEVAPALLQFAPYDWMNVQFVGIRFLSDNVRSLRTGIANVVESIDPAWHADLKMLDDNFVKLHQKDLQLGRVFGLFAGLAIFTSCMGLLGLAAFAAARRTREIGIRKVLGATEKGIIELLSKDFLRLVFLALLIATPIAWYSMQQWLNSFVYKIDIKWWYFAITGILALFIAALTVGWQALKVARSSPVDALRTE